MQPFVKLSLQFVCIAIGVNLICVNGDFSFINVNEHQRRSMCDHIKVRTEFKWQEDNRQTFQFTKEHDKVQEAMLYILNLSRVPDFQSFDPKESVSKFVSDFFDYQQKRMFSNQANLHEAWTNEAVSDHSKDTSIDKFLNADKVVLLRNKLSQQQLIELKKSPFNANLFVFPVDSIKNLEGIFTVELHVYRNPSILKQTDYDKLTLKVYEFRKFNESKPTDNRLIDSITFKQSHKGWIRFNITSAFGKWIRDKPNLFGVYMSIKDNAGNELNPQTGGLFNDRHNAGNVEHQPFLAVHYKTSEEVLSFNSVDDFERAHENQQENSSRQQRSTPSTGTDIASQSCALREFHVAIKDLPYLSYIKSPKVLSLHLCKGTCNYPVNVPTNTHTILMSMLHMASQSSNFNSNAHWPNDLPEVQCVPVTYGPLEFMYMDEFGNMISSSIKDIIALSCGCMA